MSNKIIVRYSDEFEKEDFLEINKIENVEIINYKQKGLDPTAYIYLILPLFGFTKGYFTKFGERLGERSADALFDNLKLLTNKLFELVKKKKSNTVVGIYSSHITEYGETQTRIFLSNINNMSDKEKLELIHNIYLKIVDILDSKKEYIREISVSYNNDSITDLFYVNDKIEVFEVEL